MRVFYVFFAVISLFGTSAFAESVPSYVKKECSNVFEKKVLAGYGGTQAESVRMSKNVTVTVWPARRADILLLEISANFYVKWPRNTSESRELAGGRMVYNLRSMTCRSVTLGEFHDLKR